MKLQISVKSLRAGVGWGRAGNIWFSPDSQRAFGMGAVGQGSSANLIKSKTEDRHLGRTRPLGAAVLYLKSCQAWTALNNQSPSTVIDSRGCHRWRAGVISRTQELIVALLAAGTEGDRALNSTLQPPLTLLKAVKITLAFHKRP